MSLCLTGLATGPICFGSVMDRMHGAAFDATGTGLSVLAVAYASAVILMLHRPT